MTPTTTTTTTPRVATNNLPTTTTTAGGNPYIRPWLRVITDPRASGIHTLAALRSLQRLMEEESLPTLRPYSTTNTPAAIPTTTTNTLSYFSVPAQELCLHILGCKFEQTNPMYDEAVEMAIANVLRSIFLYYYYNGQSSSLSLYEIPATVVLDAVNTIFVTRHTFLHTSTALTDHLEDVLHQIIVRLFADHTDDDQDDDKNENSPATFVLEFLVHQLLHTPLVGGNASGSSSSGGGGGGHHDNHHDETTKEARQAHDDTRIVCLKLIRRALQVYNDTMPSGPPIPSTTTTTTLLNHHHHEHGDAPLTTTHCPAPHNHHHHHRTLLSLIQDDLCLSLLMTGQAIWAGATNNMGMSAGFISLDVLAEICNVLSILWHSVPLRPYLIPQFETIWTGFYTRALVLLRKRPQPIQSASLFHANALFDAEIEIILESLVDLLCLHDHTTTVADGNGGTIETLFSLYDCHLRRSDVATGLLVELSRCCGGTVIDTEGQFASTTSHAATPLRHNSKSDFENDTITGSTPAAGGTSVPTNVDDFNDSALEKVDYPVRSVPAHLKELCAQALTGGMKCLFRDDHASPETVRERLQRKRSIMVRLTNPTNPNMEDVDDDNDNATGIGPSHVLRDLKSKKRLLAKAARIFNKKASRGIEFLVDAGLVPDPITPASVASFLRNGIVLGLDKRAVGAYLGEAGKAPIAGKSPPSWERDWFHKDVLRIYCTLFRFEDQTLLDGLRMFLATFRLPGEAQQIDRILQAFSDTCSQVCEECKIGIFSSDPKRASDAAYLLSFSIIMLNTDRHNKNIREDRKMSSDDFYKNNYDYGRDITEKGKEFPRDYLASIYDSINEEEIRTEGEGADGAMTVERWKDVLRGFTDDDSDFMPTTSDADDVTELVLEHVWRPIISAIGALWNVNASRSKYLESPSKPAEGNLLGVQGARLGMDMATEMLNGVCQLGRVDIFHRLFICICEFTGLIGDYTESAKDRVWTFANSLESQAAAIAAIRTAIENGENLDEECWKRVWAIIFELRDLKFIGRGNLSNRRGILHESEPDLLTESARLDWTMCLEKGDMDYCSRPSPDKATDKSSSLLGAFGRAFFGSPAPVVRETATEENSFVEASLHGKEALVVWDEGALSDDDDDYDSFTGTLSSGISGDYLSLGMQFEDLLVRESMEMNRQMDMPVTGLERMDETRHLHLSARARARRRLGQSCDLLAVISESRFMDETAITTVFKSLITLVSNATTPSTFTLEAAPQSARSFDRCSSDASLSSGSGGVSPLSIPMSPASEAFAEVLICELALKNKDRLKALWTDVLQDHYLSCLTRLLVNPEEGPTSATKAPVDPGLEKRITGLLRLTICAVKRKDIANDVLSAWKYVLPVNDGQHATSPLRILFRQIGEGLWRIVVDVDSISTNLNDDGWEGLVSLLGWCAKRGSLMKPISSAYDGSGSALSEDDPALQCYRTLHLLLSTKELETKVPCSVLWSLRCLVVAGGRRNYMQLSIASLDLLDILHEKKLQSLLESDPNNHHNFWSTCWRNIMDGIAEAAELSTDTVRSVMCD